MKQKGFLRRNFLPLALGTALAAALVDDVMEHTDPIHADRKQEMYNIIRWHMEWGF